MTLCLIKTAELFALPLCGFVSHQEPDLQDIISSSYAEKSDISAARLIPPANTASAIWHIISWASTDDNFSPSSFPYNNPGVFKEDQDELDFLEYVQDSQMVDLEDAFKIWAYDNMQGELDHHRKLDGNRQRNQGKVVHNSKIGATEESSPKQYKNVKDISIKDPDVAKYFNR